jgi:hypothetical protein
LLPSTSQTKPISLLFFEKMPSTKRKTAPKQSASPARARLTKYVEFAWSSMKENPFLLPRQAAEQACRGKNVKIGSVVRALQRRLKADRGEKKRHGNLALDSEQESIVVGWIEAYALCSSPLTDSEILLAVNTAFKKTFTFGWISGFKKRHADLLTTRRARPIQTRRIRDVTARDIDDWIERHEKFLERLHIPGKARFNSDETRIIPPTDLSRVLTGKISKLNSREARTTSLGTLVPFVSATGEVLISFYIVKDSQEATFKWVPETTGERGSWPRMFAMNKTGYNNRTLWAKMLNKFEQRWHLLNPGLNAAIYVDNCALHRDDKEMNFDKNFVLSMAKKGIFIIFFPPNCTAWMQPLDDVAFGLFKIELGRKKRSLCLGAAFHHNTDGKLSLTGVIEVENKTFTPRTIKKSWYNTGMAHPADPSTLNLEILRKRIQEVWGVSAVKKKLTADVREISRAMNAALHTQVAPPTITKTRRCSGVANVLYNPDELITRFDAEVAEKKNLEKEKQRKKETSDQEKIQKVQQRVNAKRESAEEKEKSQNEKKRARLVKSFLQQRRINLKKQANCQICQKSFRQGSGWIECETCNNFNLCPTCKSLDDTMEEHEQKCCNQNESDSEEENGHLCDSNTDEE